jgi:uncharacterized protein YbjT (DUF2867 family)
MKVFVTGATGFVGKEVVAHICQQGHSVRLLVRSASPGTTTVLSEGKKMEIVSGDILQPKSLEAGVAGCDAVVHLVGIISEARSQTYERVHVGGTKNVLAASQAAGVQRFLHMSALGTRPGAISRYHQSKWAAEELVRGAGIPWTIFRPSLIFGRHDAFVNLYAKFLRRLPVVPLMGSPSAQFEPVSVNDVATAFAQALLTSESIGKTYDLVGPEKFTLRQIVKIISRVSSHHGILWQVPNGLARFQAGLLELGFARLAGKPPPLNRDQLLMLQENNAGDGSAAIRDFGLQLLPFEQGIRQYVR